MRLPPLQGGDPSMARLKRPCSIAVRGRRLPGQAQQDRAFRARVAVAALRQVQEGRPHLGQLGHLAVDVGDAPLGQRLHLGAAARAVAPQRQQVADRLHREAEAARALDEAQRLRSEEHTSELQSLMRISYAVFCLKKKRKSYVLYCV